MLRLLADRDHQITAQRTRTICRLHALLCLLIEGGTVRGITVASGEQIATDHVVLALGHSARDTFEMLHARGVFMEPKPFSIGSIHTFHDSEIIAPIPIGATVRITSTAIDKFEKRGRRYLRHSVTVEDANDDRLYLRETRDIIGEDERAGA